MSIRAALIAAAAVAVAMPALAHHSFAMFDQQKTLTIDGTVKDFELINPHSWLYVVTKDASGKTAEWVIEMGVVGGMARAGWQPDTVKPGDKIVVDVHPLKDGTHGGQYISARLSDGTLMLGGDIGIPPLAR